MNLCKNCGETFEEPQFIRERERIDYGIGSQWVTLFEGHVCPYCENDDFEEICEDEEDA